MERRLRCGCNRGTSTCGGVPGSAHVSSSARRSAPATPRPSPCRPARTRRAEKGLARREVTAVCFQRGQCRVGMRRRWVVTTASVSPAALPLTEHCARHRRGCELVACAAAQRDQGLQSITSPNVNFGFFLTMPGRAIWQKFIYADLWWARQLSQPACPALAVREWSACAGYGWRRRELRCGGSCPRDGGSRARGHALACCVPRQAKGRDSRFALRLVQDPTSIERRRTWKGGQRRTWRRRVAGGGGSGGGAAAGAQAAAAARPAAGCPGT